MMQSDDCNTVSVYFDGAKTFLVSWRGRIFKNLCIDRTGITILLGYFFFTEWKREIEDENKIQKDSL